ncbi:hypothetical protein UPYG_G00303180 [Umbra pygmaea]|uniref:C2H2-type domain-containing protein n=1 Tax=Umbra pygmaea TaxID=75934 RepID=A0ABD0WB44_UMBPY
MAQPKQKLDSTVNSQLPLPKSESSRFVEASWVVFPVEYGPNFETALQTLVCSLLSRLEELLPVPDFKQTSLLTSAAPSVLEDYMHCVSQSEDLKSLYCGEGPFPGIAELRVHQNVHDGEEVFQCKKVLGGPEKSFHFKNVIDGEKKPFQCGRGFSLKASLHNHKQHYSTQTSQICFSCGKSFRCKGNLKIHMRTHTGEKPYQCTYCDKRFCMRGNLTIHIRTHTGEKPFLCSDCGKAFCSAGELQIHRRTHTGERPYKCTVSQR